MDIIDDVTKREISAGKNPMRMAATVLYISCLNAGEKKTQKDIAEAAGITGFTIRKRFKDLTNRSQLIRAHVAEHQIKMRQVFLVKNPSIPHLRRE